MARFYRLVRLVIDLLVLRGRTDRSKDAEILVLRHQLAVLHRQHTRPRFEPDDRALLTALSSVVGRDRWSMFLVKPDTILRWHRRLVANHWTYPHRPGRPSTAVEIRRTIIGLARESDVGLPAHPRRTRPARHHHRRIDRMGSPQASGRRPRTPPELGVVDGVSPHASRRDRRLRLLLCRHRPATPLLRAVLHRARHAPRAPRRHHGKPDRRLDHPSCPEPHDALRPDDPVLDPRRRRPVHRRVR